MVGGPGGGFTRTKNWVQCKLKKKVNCTKIRLKGFVGGETVSGDSKV